MTIIGFDFFGTHFFGSSTSSVNNMYYGEIKNGIYDELNIRERTDISMNNNKDTWEIDHRAIFNFANNLEGGNIENSGLQITKFAIKRRRTSELNPLTLDYVDFVNDSVLVHYDYTQPNDDLIYSVVPVAENELEGNPSDAAVESKFTGWWVVNKDTNDVIAFDKAIGNVGDTDTQLNQGRVVIETLSKYNQIYYTPKEYNTFSLSTVIVADESSRSGVKVEAIMNKFIRNHLPVIVKSGDGRIFICDLHNPRITQPQNTWSGYDYFTLTCDFEEIEDYDTFITEWLGEA